LEWQAVVPYFFGLAAFGDTFLGAAAYLAAARDQTVFGDFASDATTLARTNVRYAPPVYVPDAAAAALIDATELDTCRLNALNATRAASEDAAARLAENHRAIAGFAVRTCESV
jgi:hypothetical protein